MADAVRASEQRWSAETEQGVVVAVYRAADTDGYGAMPRPDGVFDPALRDARAALAYLADSGRLLPDGGEIREERGYWNSDTREVQTWWSYHDRGYKAPDRRRSVTTWPNGSQYIGPWEPVHD